MRDTEINVDAFVRSENPHDYFASRAEKGDGAGPITWRNAQSVYGLIPITDGQLQALFKNLNESGFEFEEPFDLQNSILVANLRTVLVQLVSEGMREFEDVTCKSIVDATPEDWLVYEAESRAGNIHGNLFIASGPNAGEDEGKIHYEIG